MQHLRQAPFCTYHLIRFRGIYYTFYENRFRLFPGSLYGRVYENKVLTFNGPYALTRTKDAMPKENPVCHLRKFVPLYIHLL